MSAVFESGETMTPDTRERIDAWGFSLGFWGMVAVVVGWIWRMMAGWPERLILAGLFVVGFGALVAVAVRGEWLSDSEGGAAMSQTHTPTMAERIAQYRVSMTATSVAERPVSQRWEGHASSTHYRVTVRRGGRWMVIYYSMGPAHTDGPTLPDVLDCLVSDAEYVDRAFEEFCADLGYDEDSRTAERVYQACVRTGRALRRLFTLAELETLRYETERQ